MTKNSHHSYIIDDVDLGRIIDKSKELEKIINWLEKLKTLDSTISKDEVDEVIKDMLKKKNTLDKKANRAVDEMAEEAELLSNANIFED